MRNQFGFYFKFVYMVICGHFTHLKSAKVVCFSFVIYILRKLPRYNHRGSQLYFHITRYVLKRRRENTFWGPKVKVEFRHLFSLQKRFSLCSFHKINANIDVFCWFSDWLVYSGITLVFKFQAVWTTSYHTQFRFLRT